MEVNIEARVTNTGDEESFISHTKEVKVQKGLAVFKINY